MRPISKILLTVLATVGLAVSNFSGVYAASSYDNAYTHTNQLLINSADSSDEFDISTTWASYLLDRDNVAGYSCLGSCFVHGYDVSDAFRNAVNNGGTWSVSQYTILQNGTMGNDQIVQWVEVLFSSDSSVPLQFNTGSTSPASGSWYRVYIGYSSTEHKPFAAATGINLSPNAVQVSSPDYAVNSNYAQVKNFLYTGSVTYPEGYEGQQVVSTYAVDPNLTFSIDVVGLSVSVKSTTPSPPLGSVCWWVFDKDPSQAGDTEMQQDVTDTFDCNNPAAGAMTYNYETVGDYTVFLYLKDGDDVYTSNDNFHIDGTTYSGTVDKDGFTNSSAYEDCATTDLACHLRNLGVRLQKMFVFLFVPNMVSIQTYLTGFLNTLKTSFGFLYAPIDFIVQFFGLFSSQVVNPTGDTCNLGNLTLFGASANVELCRWRYDFPQLWTLMQRAIQGGIAFSLIFAYWRKFNGIFGNHIEEYDDSEDTSGWEWVDPLTGERGSIHDGSINRRGR